MDALGAVDDRIYISSIRSDQSRLLILLLPPQQCRRVHVELPGGAAEGAFDLEGLGDEGHVA